jgi:type II secretory pathway component GspD/PulD (secretin)
MLESILKFKGLAMTRAQGGLVTIVPLNQALEADPQLVDPNNPTIETGSIVVTRVFELEHIDAISAANLLENMKLGVAISPIEETKTVIVTCYAHRMDRIEQLLDLVDKPGKARKFRVRQLRYIMAAKLIGKLTELARELQDVPIAIIPASNAPTTQSGGFPTPPPALTPQRASASANPRSPSQQTVYLDADERKDRILMIGYEEQLSIVEDLIDALDVVQKGIQAVRLYGIRHINAQEAQEKLKELRIAGEGRQTTTPIQPSPQSASSKTGPGQATGSLVEEAQTTVLETTNSLLVNATEEQHNEIATVIRYIDVAPEDLRLLRIYPVEHVDAEEVERQLSKFDIAGTSEATDKIQSTVSTPAPASPFSPAPTQRSQSLRDEPQISVLKATNSLLVNATLGQHERIVAIIKHVDVEARISALPYEIYFLENQDPEQLAQVLDKLIQETITNAEGKVEQKIQKLDEAVTIVPDKNTFSLIVHASRKHQDWIAGLIERLDKQRPQVLIDVTLVEITKGDAFNYDLNLITSAPDLTYTSGLTGTLVPGADPITSADILDRLAAGNRSQFADFQSSGGELTAFYGDKHINLLLQAMQSKNYGRVLAKPKILVNDNEPGTIKTADTTYVMKQASIPVGTGGGGTDIKLVQTEVNYEPYEAGITLNITPHISQGDLLRLNIELTRSDFRTTENSEKPPDTTSSELKTTVFVPDRSTIILGGLLRLNQNKAGTKVPILGDVPIIGGLFRSINNRDQQSKLYIFVKTEIIRPPGTQTQGVDDLESVSQRNREAFEKHEQEFQKYQNWPGIKSKPVDPPKVLDVQ